jgi:hypothetical protein
MIELPPTPLQGVPKDPAKTEPALFLKREDLLPFGGGNKVRRFLFWLKELSESESSPGTHLRNKTVAVLSDRGAHTFRVLTRMLEGEVSPIASLVFWERATPGTPYSNRIRRTYMNHPNISVRSGASLEMFLRFLWTKCLGASGTEVMGVGGSVSTKGQPYRKVFEECLRQLAELGKAETRVWHLFPVASGNMADFFLRAIREKTLTNHRVIGVLTGPVLLLRLFVRFKYLWERNIVLVRRPRLSWSEYEAAATRFFKRTGVWVDPNHMLYAASLLDDLPPFVRREDVVIFWVTCPFVQESDFLL